jgi:glyoxylase-like metal-dependent hydrolase (beta-lactamase superfamily II)
MMLPPDLHLCRLLRDYLAATAEGRVDAALPKTVMDNGLEPELPSIVLAAKETDASRGARAEVDVSVILLTWLRADDSGAALAGPQTTRAEAAEILAELDRRLRDRAAFGAWLMTLETAAREGWRLMKIEFKGLAAPMREPSGRVHYALQLRVVYMRSQMVGV